MRISARILLVLLGATVAFSPVVRAGDLDPPGAPAPTMVTLQELQDRLTPVDTCFDNVGRFAVCGDGTVKDTLTGLFWLETAITFTSTSRGSSTPTT